MEVDLLYWTSAKPSRNITAFPCTVAMVISTFQENVVYKIFPLQCLHTGKNNL